MKAFDAHPGSSSIRPGAPRPTSSSASEQKVAVAYNATPRLHATHLLSTAAVDPDPELRHQPAGLPDADANPERLQAEVPLASRTRFRSFERALPWPSSCWMADPGFCLLTPTAVNSRSPSPGSRVLRFAVRLLNAFRWLLLSTRCLINL